MTPINIDSTSDSPEAVTAALGDLAQEKTIETKPEEKPAEGNPKDSETEIDPETEEPAEDEESSGTDNEAETEESEAKENETQQSKAKKKGGFQRRVDKLNAKNQALEQEKEFWRQEALKAKQNPGEKTEQPQPTKQPDLKRPKADDYASHDEYVEALADWKLELKLSERDRQQKEVAIKNEAQTKVAKYNERLTEFRKTHDDWDEVISSVATVPLSLTVNEAILESDIGPELAYELSKDPKEFARICAMKPIEAAKTIGKIEARLSKPATEIPPERKLTTKAPPPVTPVRSRGAGIVKDIYRAEEMTQAEWNRMRDEQERSRSARR